VAITEGEAKAGETDSNVGVFCHPRTEERNYRMKATLTIVGNQRDGYKLTAKLPAEWVKQFSLRMGVRFWNKTLKPDWHTEREEEGYRFDSYEYDTLAAAQDDLRRLVHEIEAAKAALATITNTEIVREIEL